MHFGKHRGAAARHSRATSRATLCAIWTMIRGLLCNMDNKQGVVSKSCKLHYSKYSPKLCDMWALYKWWHRSRSSQVIFCKRALYFMALLRREICNLRHPMHFRHPRYMCNTWNLHLVFLLKHKSRVSHLILKSFCNQITNSRFHVRDKMTDSRFHVCDTW